MTPADDPLADLSAAEQRALVELAQARVDGRVNRRDVLAGGAGMAVGAAGLASLTGGGSAQPTGDEGSVGTQGNRVEAWISEADADSIDTDVANITNIGASAYLSTDQSISANTNTKVQIDTEKFDDFGAFDTANYQYEVDRAGTYRVTCAVEWLDFSNNFSAGDRVLLILKINGGGVVRNAKYVGGNYNIGQELTHLAQLSSGDTLFVEVNHDASDSVRLSGSEYSRFEISKEA